MKRNVMFVLVVVMAVAAGSLGSYLFLRGSEEDADTVVAGAHVIKSRVIGDVKKVTEISLVDKKGKKFVRVVESQQVRPGAAVQGLAAEGQADDVDEEELTELQKSVLQELQDALDNNNLKQVRKALSKFVAKADRGGLGGRVPACMRSRAVAALGWFGKDAAVDLIGYVADPSEDVSSEASSQFELALSDSDMGDYERAQILTAALQAINDADLIESLLGQLDNMRNSVKAQTAEAILETGTEVAQSKMKEQLEFYFNDETVNSDGIEKWKAMNPDDSDDDATYGGSDPAANRAIGVSQKTDADAQ